MKNQRLLTRSLRDDWFEKHIKYIQKINDISPFDDDLLQDKAEDFCSTKSEWVLKENDSKWVDCFKKASNLDINIKAMEGDFKCEKPPFKSKKLLQMIQQKGRNWCLLKYLEYITLKCNLQDSIYHTELGQLYIQQISKVFKKYKNKEVKAEDKDTEDANNDNSKDEVIKEEADKDEDNAIKAEKDDKDDSKAAEGASHDNKDNELAKTYDLEKAKQDKEI